MLKENRYLIKVDTIVRIANPYYEIVAGDYLTNIFDFEVTQNNEKYDLTGLIVEIDFLKPDKTLNRQDMNNGVVITDEVQGYVSCALHPNSMNVQGRARGELKIFQGLQLLTSIQFEFLIRDPLAKDNILESDTNFPVLTKLIASVDSLEKDVVQAEEIRVIGEHNRINSEDDRATNENTRVSNENLRTFNEASRATAEASRAIAEGLRVTKEDARISNEDTRKSNETSRVAAEALRVTQEDARKAAELIRISNEEDRIAAEGLRDGAYNQAELARDGLYSTAETARDSLYNTAEGSRNTQYITAEGNRGTSYTQAESARDGLYATAELGRDNDYADAETARDGLYDAAEANRDSLYNTAEAARDVKMGTLANLTTTEKGSIVGAVNEIDAELVAHKEDYAKDKQPFHFNHAAQQYLNIYKYFEALKDGEIYTTEFYHHSISPFPVGVKKDANADKICEPSTSTVRGRDDYEKIGLFTALDVNAYVDISGDYHVTAIKGDGRFAKDGTMGDVYVMSMEGYQKRYETDTVWGVSYSDTMHPGFEILDEAVKPDGTIRPYLLHAKYVAGRNPHENNNLASISGVYPEFVNMSHNGQITEFGKKGSQYSGKTSHDDYYVQLMMWLKHATTISDTIMKGCQSYYLQYTNLAPEIGVKRVIITNSQAINLLIGSTVSIGDYGTGSITTDRQSAQNYNIANRVKITDIVDLGDGNSVVYVDSPNTFDTTLTTTITTYPWNTGGCDNVLGQDGSPYSNTSGKEPFIINGIEMCVGGYEVLQNLIIHNNSDDNRIDVYANYDCTTYATSPNANYDLVGQLAQTNNTWKYGSKMVIPKNHPSVILVTEADASSTTGTGDGIYTNPPSNGGYRAWRSLGGLVNGALCGFRCLAAGRALSAADWDILGRLSATGRSRRRAGVN